MHLVILRLNYKSHLAVFQICSPLQPTRRRYRRRLPDTHPARPPPSKTPEIPASPGPKGPGAEGQRHREAHQGGRGVAPVQGSTAKLDGSYSGAKNSRQADFLRIHFKCGTKLPHSKL